jgi:hypothetical protein
MRLTLLVPFGIFVTCCLSACHTTSATSSTRAPNIKQTAVKPPQTKLHTANASLKTMPDAATRNNALALLNDLLGDEKNVSKILIIKRNSEELKRLIKDISDTAGNGAKLLESFASRDSTIQLAATDLPPGEVAARKAISKLKERDLLHTKNAEFEFQLLLTQSEAMNYGAALAKVAAENETQPEHARALSTLSTRFKMLHDQVLTMLRKGH